MQEDIDTYKVISARVLEEREKAIRVSAPEFDGPKWIPKSLIHDDSEVWKEGQRGDLVVPEWFAEKSEWF